MISFEINQQTGKKVAKTLWSTALKKIIKTLNFKKSGQLSLALVDSRAIKQLNKIYRQQDKVTDVLSFSEINSKKFGPRSTTKNYLGEVIICYPQAIKQAKERKIKLENELELLFIHGVLHLFGYDHEKSKEAEVMRRLERKILAKT